MNIKYDENKIILTDICGFDLKKTFECGQCFRFNQNENGFEGVAHGKLLSLCQDADSITITGVTKEEFESTFIKYFDLERDYAEIDKALSQDKVLKPIIPFSTGIRILNQEPFETVISFIISASNNIPRIKKIIGLLCENFGERREYCGKTYYTFPTPEAIAKLSLSDLAVIKAGFRDKYILDCAQKIASKDFDINTLFSMSYADAKKSLMTLHGVGSKVADCALLFSFGFIESFPKDVWIKRILKSFYGVETDEGIDFYGYGGIAQQYLFYYARETSLK